MELACPAVKIVVIQCGGLYRDDASRIGQLTVRRRNPIPKELVQNHVLGRRNPGWFAEERDLNTALEHFLIERLRTGQPEIDLQRGTSVNSVELVRWFVDRADGGLLDVEIATEFVKNERHGSRGKLYDKI